MAKPIRLQVRTIVKNIQDTVGRSLTPQEMRFLAMATLDSIVKRSRAGFGVERNFGVQRAFPALSKSYIEFRKRYKKLAKTTSPRKSNITLTGELLDSIGILRTNQGSLVIGATGTRSSGLTNEKLVGYLARKDRYFLRLSNQEFKQFVQNYQKTLRSLLDRARLR